MWNTVSPKLEASQSNSTTTTTTTSNAQLPQTSTNAAGSIKGSFSMYSMFLFFFFSASIFLVPDLRRKNRRTDGKGKFSLPECDLTLHE